MGKTYVPIRFFPIETKEYQANYEKIDWKRKKENTTDGGNSNPDNSTASTGKAGSVAGEKDDSSGNQ